MKLLAVDPGTHSGWCVIDTDVDPKVQQFGTTHSQEEFHQLLDSGNFNDVDKTIVEDYKIRPAKGPKDFQHNWDAVPAIHIIGAIEFWCFEYSIPCVLQQAAIKPAAAGLTGLPYEKGKKNMHHIDAMLHGLYFLVKSKTCSAPEVRIKNPVGQS